jgi:hypothetical protein|tara:strand:- start:989 stop:1291 length:303 start_codon:yes stop_codon:yes gene_type:complete
MKQYLLMKFIKWLLFGIAFSQQNITRDFKPRVYTRITINHVQHAVIDFLMQNNINNCYQFLEEHSHMILKCWGGEFWEKKQLFEVDIIVRKEYLSNKITY